MPNRNPTTPSTPHDTIEADDALLVNRAMQHIQQQDNASATAILQDVVSRTPTHYQERYQYNQSLYIKFWDSSEFMSYVVWMEQMGIQQSVHWVLNAYPRAYCMLAYLSVEAGDMDKAMQWLNQGLQLDPTHPKLNHEMAQVWMRLGNHAQAKALYDRLLASQRLIDPKLRAVCLRGKGYTLIELDDLDMAEQAFNDSLTFDPQNQLAINELLYIEKLRNYHLEAARMGVRFDQFKLWYEAYSFSLAQFPQTSHWNQDIDPLARDKNALSENEIKQAETDIHQAILNRIKMRLIMTHTLECSP